MGPLESVCITLLLQHYCISPICFKVPGGLLSLLKAHIRGSQLDELQEPHCSNQLRQQPCINYSLSNFMAYHFCSSHYNSFSYVSRCVRRPLRPHSRRVLWARKAREYYIFTSKCVNRTRDLGELTLWNVVNLYDET